MDRMYEGYRYRDRQGSYVANMNTYHCGTSMMANMVDQGFFVEPLNAPAFFEYIKNLENGKPEVMLYGMYSFWELLKDLEMAAQKALFYEIIPHRIHLHNDN